MLPLWTLMEFLVSLHNLLLDCSMWSVVLSEIISSPFSVRNIWKSQTMPQVYSEVLVTQLCPAVCDPMDYSPPDSSVHGILQVRCWRGLPFPSPGDDLPDPGVKSRSPALQAASLLSEPPGKPPSGNLLDSVRGNNFCHRYSYVQVWHSSCELPDPCNSFLSLATG